MNKNPAMDIVQ